MPTLFTTNRAPGTLQAGVDSEVPRHWGRWRARDLGADGNL